MYKSSGQIWVCSFVRLIHIYPSLTFRQLAVEFLISFSCFYFPGRGGEEREEFVCHGIRDY